MNRRILLILLGLASLLSLSAQELDGISFSSDYTRAQIINDEKSLILSGNAWIETGSTAIRADRITIGGSELQLIICEGDVSIEDTEQGISLSSHRLTYDREKTILRIEGWAEMEDLKNGVIAKSGYLENSQTDGTTLLQIQVRLYIDTEDGPMICLTDSAWYDSLAQLLEMTGSSKIYWKGNTYEASQISVDLKNEEISLEGRVKGTIYE